MKSVHHSINMAARKSGLSPHVIRVWERRYGAVKPTRTVTNRRLYGENEIERLGLLRQAVALGYRIGNIATLDAEDLKTLLATAPATPPTAAKSSTSPPDSDSTSNLTARCLEAIRQMDAQALEGTLTRALIQLGNQGLLVKVVTPVAQSMGELWMQGSLTAAHEHFASAFLKTFLGNAARPYALGDAAPALIVATPSGQVHELGAIMIASAANNRGWRVVNLGANLPAAEIAGAAIQNQALAVAISLVYPADDPQLPRELTHLRKLLPPETHILAGGRASAAYGDTLTSIGAYRSEDLDDFCRELDHLRTPA